jgi:hypothetical protein
MKRHTAVLSLGLLALVLLVGGVVLVSTVSPVAAQESANATNDTGADADGGGWTLEELRRDGRQPSGSPASVRQANESMFWLIHWPARSVWADVGNPNDGEWQYVSGAVTDNSVYLRTINTDGDREMDLTIVSYRTETREIETESGSVRQERVPVDIVEKDVTATLGTGWSIAEVPLPDLEEDRQVLIYAESAPDDLRWTISHEPVATSQSVPISTHGDYLWRVGTEVFFPALIGAFIVGVLVRAAIRRAGAGPQWGLTQWAIVLFFGALFGFVFGPVEDTADLLVAAPTLLAVVLVAIFGIVALESWEDRTKNVLFVKPDIEAITSPSGKQGLDALVAESDEETIAEMPDGRTAVIRKGIGAFFARVFGAAAYLREADIMVSSVNLEGSSHDELVFVKPDDYDEIAADGDADEENPENLPEVRDGEPLPDGAIRYRPEGWAFEMPPLDTLEGGIRAFGIAGAIALGSAAVYAALGVWFGIGVGVAATAVWLARPKNGRVKLDPAPGHLRSAIITAMVMSSEIADAETLDEARKENIKLRGQSERDIEQALATQDATLIEALLRGGEDNDPLQRSIVDGIDVDGDGADGSAEAATDGGTDGGGE